MHKRIGLIGGTTPESTIGYYKYLTEKYFEKNGDHGYPEILIFSVSFQKLVDWATAGEWDKVEETLIEAALTLEKAGAEIVSLTANTLHKMFPQIQASIGVPMISIIDTLIAAIKKQGLERIALLGTKTTMEEPFYAEALAEAGIEVFTPESDEREFINHSIYGELSRGIITEETRKRYQQIAEKAGKHGAEGIVLGCTEIPMVLTEKDTNIPLFDTLEIHAEEILNFAT